MKKMEENDWRDKEVEVETLMRRSASCRCTTPEHSCTFASASCCRCEWRSGSETRAPVCSAAGPLAPDPDSAVRYGAGSTRLLRVPVFPSFAAILGFYFCFSTPLGLAASFYFSLSVLAASKCEIGEIRRGCSDTPAAGTHAPILIKHA